MNTFRQCYDIIEAVDRNNVGIVIDCFHFYPNGSRLEDLEKADPDKIFVFHIDDSTDLPLEKLQDSDRVWPGDGIIPLDKILGALKKIGFNGVATIELFNPEYWNGILKKPSE
ncbi:MAG: sugar phosphate isomerase/epimerase [Actinobacteria bacterium]|nr:sugar phosphate isomerase/epimerase [Actinomycetota bacterium]